VYLDTYIHGVDRELRFFSSRWNWDWDTPTPSPESECAPPPPFGFEGRAHSLAGEEVGAGPNSNEGIYTLILKVFNTLCTGASLYIPCSYLLISNSFFGPKWHWLRPLPFQGPKKSRFLEPNPLPLALVIRVGIKKPTQKNPAKKPTYKNPLKIVFLGFFKFLIFL
jgi:hypothetical protein